MPNQVTQHERLRGLLANEYRALKDRFEWLDLTACVSPKTGRFVFSPRLSCGCWIRVEMTDDTLSALDGHAEAHRCEA